MYRLMLGTVVTLNLVLGNVAEPEELPERVGFHEAKYDADGRLEPWTSLRDAVEREMTWYLAAPVNAHGYPSFVYITFMNDDHTPYKTELIPATQNGMGILSYLKYWEFTGKSNPKVLEWARKMGDYLVRESLTPDEGAYPRFTRSTGINTDFPLKSASQGDLTYGVNVIEPDKGGLAGYALLRLYEATEDSRYFEQARHNATCLVKNMRTGDETRAPWPFRVDSVSGAHWGERNGNMVFILRLFNGLIARGEREFEPSRQALWDWIRTYQLPAAETREASHWIQFFEDMTEEDNRTSWAPLEMARYLIEEQTKLDAEWKTHAERCIAFAVRHFGIAYPGGVPAMGEQDTDKRAWGGACSKLGGVAAMFYAAGGGEKYKEMAYRNLVWMAYHIDVDGCPAHQTGDPKQRRGGWQEDCHTDVIHNFIDAFTAVPEWGQR